MQQLLTEILRRDFRPTQLRVLLVVATLTHGRGRDDIEVRSIEELSRLCFSARPHVSAVVDELVSLAVLARDEKRSTWWLQPVDLWQVQPDRATAAAMVATIEADDRRRQPEMFHQPHPSEFLTPTPSEFLTVPLPASARAQEPGTETRNLKAGDRGTGLDARGWMVLRELLTWCAATGEACTDDQRKHWGWRVWTQPEVLLSSLRQAVEHVEAGKPCKSRFGLVKHFWRRATGDDKLPFSPPRSADRLHGGAVHALPAGGVHASEPVGVEAGAERPPCGLKAAVLALLARGSSDGDGGALQAMLPGEGSPAPRPGTAVRQQGGDDDGAGLEDGR